MHYQTGLEHCHWQDNKEGQRGNVTESQIMSTLNSSIEDLLSKISKVTEDYECGALEESQNQRQFHVSILKENTWEVNRDDLYPFRRKEDKNAEKSTFYSSHYSQKESFQSSENIYQRTYPVNYLNRNATTLHIACNQLPSLINKSSSSKSMHQQVQKGEKSKMGKIQSLFDSTSIKEVAESQIFGQDGNEGGCKFLEESTREVEQTIAYQDNSMKYERLSLRQFQIGAEVGSGKFGEVYLCRHKATGLIFALKKIFKSTIKQCRMQQQFCLQLKILYMLNHPNIIKLYGHFSDEYHIFLLMEYVEGGELLSKLKSEERYVSRMIEQLINAVDYIHDRGIVHRDIKPENVVVAFDNTVKLCDFGWAGLFDYKSMKTTFCGTLDYVSPEMKDKGSYSSSVDLWSLGVLTFELLTGNAPFKDQITDWKKKGSKRSVAWDWNIMYPLEVSGLGQSFMRNLLKQNPDQRASLRFCKNHLFIRKHKQQESQLNIELYI